MNIIFTTSNATSPSFLFYSASLREINSQFSTVRLDISETPKQVNYENYDVALFIGGDSDLSYIKAANQKIILGLVEPRAAQNHVAGQVDFIITNSIESSDFFSGVAPLLFEYFTYPIVSERVPASVTKNKLVIGYHGNKIHLDAMYPRITNALERLNKEIPIQLWAMYNLERLGKWSLPEKKKFGFEVIHIQYAEENYASYMANVDIGTVPQLIPVKENVLLRWLMGSFLKKYNERHDNYFMRFKETTNIGRILVFAQYAIPVVSDMTPSSCAYLGDAEFGLIAYSTSGWYQSLRKLAVDKNERDRLGKALKGKYNSTATQSIQNERFVNFITKNFGLN